MNAFTMIGDLRHNLNEYNDALHKGTSTSGKYDNGWLMREGINPAQAQLYEMLVLAIRDEFIGGPVDVPVVSSVITLPTDFGSLVDLRDESGNKVFKSTIRHRPAEPGAGSRRMYYRRSGTLVINRSGINSTYNMTYIRKPRDLDQGIASADNTLASTASFVEDYYNGMVLENVTDEWSGVVDDYTTNRIVTIADQTLNENDYYGFVSEIPLEFAKHIVSLATMFCKQKHPSSQEKPSTNDYRLFADGVNITLRAFAGNDIDVDVESLWDNNYHPTNLGFNVPGHINIVY